MKRIKEIYEYIDRNLDDHVTNLQEFVRQPSISNTGEGIRECADLQKRYFEEMIGAEAEVIEPGVTKWGTEGHPVVFGKYDTGAEKTLILYFMYDTMPVLEAEKWSAPPHEAKIIKKPPFGRVVTGRGAVNSKGPEMSFLNALESIKNVEGELPVNLMLISEGDEERMSIGLHKFVNDYKDELEEADAALASIGWLDPTGRPLGGAGLSCSEGCLYTELETSGESWGKGPTKRNIFPSHQGLIGTGSSHKQHICFSLSFHPIRVLLEPLGREQEGSSLVNSFHPIRVLLEPSPRFSHFRRRSQHIRAFRIPHG